MLIYSEFTASYAKLTTAQKPEITANRTFNELFILLTVFMLKYFTSFLSAHGTEANKRAINRPKRRNEADK
jgi:hypothetical protein